MLHFLRETFTSSSVNQVCALKARASAACTSGPFASFQCALIFYIVSIVESGIIFINDSFTPYTGLNMILLITTTIIVIGFLIKASIRPKNFPPGK